MWIAKNPLTMAYDVEAIRRDFPGFCREVHFTKTPVYLDNGASAQKPQSVIDAVTHAYANEYANVPSRLHFLSNAATDAYEKSRETVRRLSSPPVLWTRSSSPRMRQRRSTPSLMAMECRSSARAMKSLPRSWSIIPTSRRGISYANAQRETGYSTNPVDDNGVLHIEEFGEAPERTYQTRCHHAYVEYTLGTVVLGIKKIAWSSCPCTRRSGSGRWQSGCSAPAGRDAGSGP